MSNIKKQFTLKPLLHKIVAIPLIYDLVQTLVGARLIRRRFKRYLAQEDPYTMVVDVGGGTGLNRALLPEFVTYICVDNDQQKLKGFTQKRIDGTPILGDGTSLPLKTASIDIVICTAVIHHIPDDVLLQFVEECLRLLKPGGRFVFFDPVWVQDNLMGQLLWRYDRGTFPRSAKTLHALLDSRGCILHWDQFSILHSYVIGVVTKKQEDC